MTPAQAQFPPHILVHIDGAGPAVWILGHKRQEVAGEYHRWEALHEAVDRIRASTSQEGSRESNRDGTTELTHFAWLLREPSNAFDANTVAVYIGASHVGYLPRPAAKFWASQIEALESKYRRHVACTLRVRSKSEDGYHSIFLLLTTSLNPTQRRKEF